MKYTKEATDGFFPNMVNKMQNAQIHMTINSYKNVTLEMELSSQDSHTP